MERLSGAYRRRAQFASLVIGISVALAINADSLAIANSLWTHPLVRDALVTQAELFNLPEEELSEPLQEALQAAIELQELPIPVGWSADNIPHNGMGWFLKAGGIMASGVAAAQVHPLLWSVSEIMLP
jgi:hypothetical protein